MKQQVTPAQTRSRYRRLLSSRPAGTLLARLQNWMNQRAVQQRKLALHAVLPLPEAFSESWQDIPFQPLGQSLHPVTAQPAEPAQVKLPYKPQSDAGTEDEWILQIREHTDQDPDTISICSSSLDVSTASPKTPTVILADPTPPIPKTTPYQPADMFNPLVEATAIEYAALMIRILQAIRDMSEVHDREGPRAATSSYAPASFPRTRQHNESDEHYPFSRDNPLKLTRRFFHIQHHSLQALKCGRKLDDEVVHTSLAIIRDAVDDKINVVDPAVPTVDMDQSSLNSGQILVPLHIRDSHWALAVVNKTRDRVLVYDSLPSASSSEVIVAKIAEFSRECLSSRRRLSIQISSPLLQQNSEDCGVLLLAAAFYVSADMLVPETIDARAWRGMLFALLDPLSNAEDQALNADMTKVNDLSEVSQIQPILSSGLWMQASRVAKSISKLMEQIVTLEESVRSVGGAIRVLDVLMLDRGESEALYRLSSARRYCEKFRKTREETIATLRQHLAKARETIEYEVLELPTPIWKDGC